MTAHDRGAAIVVQPDEGESYWQPVPAISARHALGVDAATLGAGLARRSTGRRAGSIAWLSTSLATSTRCNQNAP